MASGRNRLLGSVLGLGLGAVAAVLPLPMWTLPIAGVPLGWLCMPSGAVAGWVLAPSAVVDHRAIPRAAVLFGPLADLLGALIAAVLITIEASAAGRDLPPLGGFYVAFIGLVFLPGPLALIVALIVGAVWAAALRRLTRSGDTGSA